MSNQQYKFKSLATYSIWNESAMTGKHYRQVYDTSEITYLMVQLELYNKLFDEEDWEAEVTHKVYELKGDKKGEAIFEQTKQYEVAKDENIIVRTFGWGDDKKGGFWKVGNYLWETHMDGKMLASTKFYFAEAGQVSVQNNPYFKMESLRVYESPEGELEEEDRVYKKQFSSSDARYIMAEATLTNKIEVEWPCEMFVNFFNDSGLRLGTIKVLGYITPTEGSGQNFTLTGGWGSAKAGKWLKDNYRAEVVFMDTVVGIIPFKVGEVDILSEDGSHAVLNADCATIYKQQVGPAKAPAATEASVAKQEAPVKKQSVEEIMTELDALIGLKKVKDRIREYIDYVSYLQYRADEGLEDKGELRLHSVFTGNPGTGKTTVVQLLGRIYQSMGLLSKGHVHTVESSDLIAGYIRQTGGLTKKAIEAARGGILFIDEAYSLVKTNDQNDFGSEAIAVIIKEMSEGPGDLAIIVAGYPKEMEGFIQSNPGLKSRFKNYYHFDDYMPDELMAIAEYAASKKHVTLSDEAKIKLKHILTEAFRKRDHTFGNGRLANSLVDEAKINLGIRLVRNFKKKQLSKKKLSLIQGEDIEDLTAGKLAGRLRLEVDDALLEQALAELGSLTGLNSIKQELHELIRLTRYYKEMNRDVLKAFSMHSIFMGNPGTGKTTVARIVGKIYKALGLLERGHLVEADGSDLIAGYVGQSALKTKELVNRAMGGVLFIDEAYAIAEAGSGNGGNDFGKKAIASLIKEMEDHRSEFAVIAAGYPDNMRRFIESNPGMKSRFDKTYHFEDFTEEELWTIALSMMAKEGLKPDKACEEHLKIYIEWLYKTRNKFFGNARSIRKVMEKSYRNFELRMASMDKKDRTKKVLSTLVLKDVEEFQIPESGRQASGIGFKYGT